jgi:hypothetical protein
VGVGGYAAHAHKLPPTLGMIPMFY